MAHLGPLITSYYKLTNVSLSSCSCRPEEKIKILEKKVNDLIEESCMAQSMGALQVVSLSLFNKLFTNVDCLDLKRRLSKWGSLS